MPPELETHSLILRQWRDDGRDALAAVNAGPDLPLDSPLCRHVLYRLRREE